MVGGAADRSFTSSARLHPKRTKEAQLSEEGKRLSRAFPEYFSTGDAALAVEVLDREVASLIDAAGRTAG
jgi:hypothetical protein